MTAVFSHGRLRLYLLKLLDDGPKHGYELIRLLADRFHGTYAPSAGTIYPRLARMESEGLVTHTAAGGRKTYSITDDGRSELRQRAGELETLEKDINASVADLAAEIQAEVHGSARDLKRELREAARQTRRGTSWVVDVQLGGRPSPPGTDPQADFDRRLVAFSDEVRALVRRGRFSDDQLRTASRLLDGVLDGLRRMQR
ncbi:DNA-binding transcriptional regulator, PadR family [Asanoa hainanensis]|uniref:DNA-binding transcriptional regulator, PadR family n=1 Tax=Asanoa hainanensis TaxID=560556 RepID=A0A239K7B3_9ACTN|nr:PadR family transcriptional regulator [Asanoa hainanensis]SNT14247.1 DNA-binding transcriptional regulator, PadR family [Asanoa hainanensis]